MSLVPVAVRSGGSNLDLFFGMLRIINVQCVAKLMPVRVPCSPGEYCELDAAPEERRILNYTLRTWVSHPP